MQNVYTLIFKLWKLQSNCVFYMEKPKIGSNWVRHSQHFYWHSNPILWNQPTFDAKHNCICVCQYPFRLIAPQTSIQPTFSNIKSISHRIVLQSPFTHSRTAIGLIPIQSVDRRIGLNCHNYTHSDIFCSWYLGIISILLFCFFFSYYLYLSDCCRPILLTRR